MNRLLLLTGTALSVVIATPAMAQTVYDLGQDAQIGQNAADIGQLQTDVGQLQTDVGALQANDAQQDADIGQLQTDVGVLQANDAQQDADIGQLQTDVASLDTRVDSLEAESQYVAFNSSGPAASATGPQAMALGSGASASNLGSVALGNNSDAAGEYSVALGYGASASSDNSVALGQASSATGAASVAIGSGASDGGHNNSVALGAGSVATADNQVNVGGRTIEGLVAVTPVANGNAAATTGQLYATNQAVAANTAAIGALDQRLDVLEGMALDFGDKLDKLDRRSSAGTATAIALSGNSFLPGKSFNLTGNVGTYRGAVAMALQLGALVGENVALNAGVAKSLNKSGKLGARAGFTVGW